MHQILHHITVYYSPAMIHKYRICFQEKKRPKCGFFAILFKGRVMAQNNLKLYRCKF